MTHKISRIQQQFFFMFVGIIIRIYFGYECLDSAYLFRAMVFTEVHAGLEGIKLVSLMTQNL